MNIAVFGAKGRVGSRVVALAKSKNHNVMSIDKGWVENHLDSIDVVVDFSLPSALEDVVGLCLQHHCPLVSGVTGYNAQQLKVLEGLSKQVKVVHKSNFSIGIDMLKKIVSLLADNLQNWDCTIVETHRKGKKDAPSGTAVDLATTVSQNKSFCTVDVHSIRSGDCLGRHEIIFGTSGETITLTHTATSIDIFAKGALLVAESIA
ncbi:MAG: 4-hydroxy-tetrahydrodipicolinate reductase [Clostridia bacterium]|nr:4-hydroxy-tetrahydrodipicolinate reductase [Clostridia bacterium]